MNVLTQRTNYTSLITLIKNYSEPENIFITATVQVLSFILRALCSAQN